MNVRQGCPSRDGFFSENSVKKEELIFNWSLAMDDHSIIFSFKGPKEEVKKRVREAIQEIVPSAKYEENKNDCPPGGLQYNIYIPQNLHGHLTNMFWYLGKITDDFVDERQIVQDFLHKKISLLTSNEAALSGLSLYRAAKAAKEKSLEPLILTEAKPEDKNLWSEEDLNALKLKECSLVPKKGHCKVM